MRLLLVSHAFNNPDAGASRVYHQLADGLKQRGNEVTTLHLNDLRLDSWFVEPAMQFGLPSMLSKRAAKEPLHSFDVIMCSNGMLSPLFKKQRHRGSAALLVNHLHGLNYFDHQAAVTEIMRGHVSVPLIHRAFASRLPMRWDRLGCKYADLTIVQNDRDRDYLSEHGVSPVIKIPLSVHPKIREASQTAPEPSSRDPHQLLWFGSWIARKGAYYLPRAFELIAARCPKARLIIGGTGRPKNVLKTQFASSVLPQIDFLNKISLHDHISLLSKAAILLFPSLSEGFGYALLEAMCMGVAVVTTQTGIGGDYLTDKSSAMIVPFGSAIHLAEASIRLIEEPSFRSSIAMNGKLLSKQFTSQRFACDYENTFRHYSGQTRG
jgi:glycosyltransferase involved in cell wall biosynthesis